MNIIWHHRGISWRLTHIHIKYHSILISIDVDLIFLNLHLNKNLRNAERYHWISKENSECQLTSLDIKMWSKFYVYWCPLILDQASFPSANASWYWFKTLNIRSRMIFLDVLWRKNMSIDVNRCQSKSMSVDVEFTVHITFKYQINISWRQKWMSPA